MSAKKAAPKKELSSDRLRLLICYSEVDGVFAWNHAGLGRKKNLSAGSAQSAGYLTVRIDGVSYLCHRLAWLYVFGVFPKAQLDHINGIRTDNRIANLRECSNAENCQNVRPHKDGAGLVGVSFEKRKRKWQSGIGVNGTRIFLGYFATKEQAHSAYLSAKQIHHQFGATHV